eukprot:1462292-Pleurochrysis_carterae.AAC.1
MPSPTEGRASEVSLHNVFTFWTSGLHIPRADSIHALQQSDHLRLRTFIWPRASRAARPRGASPPARSQARQRLTERASACAETGWQGGRLAGGWAG